MGQANVPFSEKVLEAISYCDEPIMMLVLMLSSQIEDYSPFILSYPVIPIRKRMPRPTGPILKAGS